MDPLEIMRERRAAKKAELDALLAAPTDEKRDLTEDEDTQFGKLVTEIRGQDERIAELTAEAKRSASAAEARKEFVMPDDDKGPKGGAKVTDAPVYAKGNHQRSFFKDAYMANVKQDRDSAERLQRHTAQADAEQRALGNTNTTGGSGGEFAPPEWLVADYIRLARAGRVTADLYTHSDVPMGVSSVNLPKVMTGTTVAPQTTQNTALSQTDLTTGFVSTGFTTVGGKELVAQQLLDQSAIDFDQVITQDLAAAYAQQIGAQVLNGAGTGLNNNAVVNGLNNVTVANTLALTTLNAQTFYSKSAGLLAGFASARFAEPTCWVMAPRRWYWLTSQFDSAGRPLVVPDSVAYNPIATDNGPTAIAGRSGVWQGLPVYIDPNMGTTFGTANNEDRVYLLKQDDLWLFESPVRAEVFRETYADSVGVLFRMFAYVGTVLNRYPASVASLTGLVAPTF